MKRLSLFFLIFMGLIAQAQVTVTRPQLPNIDAVADGDLWNVWDISASSGSRTKNATSLQLFNYINGKLTAIPQANVDGLVSALAGKEPTITSGTTEQYWRGDKSWQTLNAAAVGLGNVENTALSTWAGSSNITTINSVQSISRLSNLSYGNGIVTTSGSNGTLEITTVLGAPNGGTGVSALSSLNLSSLGSGVASAGQYPRANGTGGIAWANLPTIAIDSTGISGSSDASSLRLLSTQNAILTETSVASPNTASAVVIRDGSGNFSAGTITAALSGNATTATALATGRTISATGDISYTSPSFDGSGNVTAAATLATVNSNTGSFGGATKSLTVTYNAKGLATSVSEQTVTPAVGSITGLGTGVGTWLATPTVSNLNAATTDNDVAILGANIFNAIQTVTQSGANAGVFSSTGYSLTGSSAVSMVDLTGMWNTTGNPSAIKLAITQTASGATSKYIELLGGAAGTTAMWSVDKAGAIKAPDGSTSACTYSFNSAPNSGIYFLNVGGVDHRLRMTCNGSNICDISNKSGASGIDMGSNSLIFGNGFNSGDMILGRGGAATLRLGVDTSSSGATATAHTIKSPDNTHASSGTGGTLTVAGGKGATAGGAVVLATSSTNGTATARVTVAANGTTTFSGNVSMDAGKTFSIASGTDQRAGEATLVAGTVTVSNTTVTANTKVILIRKTLGGTTGTLSWTVSAGSSFTVNSSSALDISTINYLLIEVP